MRILICASVVVVLSLVAASTALAQSTRRPDLNLFGRGFRDPQQSLGVTGSLGGTFYDQLRGPTFFNPDGTEVPTDGWGAFGSGSVNYNLKLANVTLDGSVGGFATYYPSQPDAFRARALPGAGAHAVWGWELTKKTHLSATASFALSPLGQASILPGGGSAGSGSDPTAPFLPQNAAFVDGTVVSFPIGVLLRHDISRRWSASADYNYRRELTFGVDPAVVSAYSLWNQTATAALHFAVTRNLSVRGGWRFDETHYSGSDLTARTSNLDLGIDYGRGAVFQLTRQTTLALGGGVSAYVDQAGGQHYRTNANAALEHQMGRTWSSSLRYIRSLDTTDILFQEPVLNDSLEADLNGLITRRLGFHASASTQQGAVGFTGTNNGILRSYANAGLQTSFSRHLSLGVDYSYYRFHAENGVPLPPGLFRDSASQGIQIFLSTWAPIYQKRGRPNVTR